MKKAHHLSTKKKPHTPDFIPTSNRADISVIYNLDLAPYAIIQPLPANIAVTGEPEETLQPVKSIPVPFKKDEILELKGGEKGTRKDIQLLKATMLEMLNDLGLSMDESKLYPSKITPFLNVIQKEQKIYDQVFHETNKQIAIHMPERAEVLNEIRKRMAKMFINIPKDIQALHTEFLAQKKLNIRLTQELERSRELINELNTDLAFIRFHEYGPGQNGKSITKTPGDVEQSNERLEEYHELYTAQRKRLEETVRASEEEKRIWIEAAKTLSLRISFESGLSDLLSLHNIETERLKLTTFIMRAIQDENIAEMVHLEQLIVDWRNELLSLAKERVNDDRECGEKLGKIHEEMRLILVSMTFENDDWLDKTDAFNQAQYSSTELIESFANWVEVIGLLVMRLSSDTNVNEMIQLNSIRARASIWFDQATKILSKNEKTVNGGEFLPLSQILVNIVQELDEWMLKMENRISGNDGTASQLMMLQNQVDDRYSTFLLEEAHLDESQRDTNQFKTYIIAWMKSVANLINAYANTTEKEQQKIPLTIETWFEKILEVLNAENDTKTEDGMKLHIKIITSIIKAILNVKNGKDFESDSINVYLLSDILLFTKNLLADTIEIEMPSHDKYEPTFNKVQTLQNQLIDVCNNWIKTANKVIPISSEVVPNEDDILIAVSKDVATEVSKTMEENVSGSLESLNSVSPDEKTS